jgi:peptide/nickel transport system permease protein
MQTYIIRRLLLIVPTLLVVSIITFGLVNLMPGDVVTTRLMESPSFRQSDLDQVRHQLGLDQPVVKRYGLWLGDVVRGDLGHALWSSKPVSSEIRERLPITLELAILSFLISSVIALVLGIFSAVRQDTPLDYGLRFLSIAGLSVPNFWLGTLFIILSARYFNYLPPLKYVPFSDDPLTNLRQFLPPSLIIAAALSGALMRMVRSSMLEVLRQDYIRTAWAKGFRERTVISRHALKNALIPVITIAGTQFAVLLGGSVIMESIFNLPGLGKLILDAVLQRDFIIIQGIVLFIVVVFTLMNLVIDLAYGWLDPRIRYH